MDFVINIEKETLENDFYRNVIYTNDQIQLVLMTLYPGEDIPLEQHEGTQFIRIERGQCLIRIGLKNYNLGDGMIAIIPPHTRHYVKNTGNDLLKLYSIYSPPEHEEGLVEERP